MEADESNISVDDGASDSGVSQILYAKTLLGRGYITIAWPPESSYEEKPFECFYCNFYYHQRISIVYQACFPGYLKIYLYRGDLRNSGQALFHKTRMAASLENDPSHGFH